ncbi:MAG: hypothetical protein IIZ19_06340, partial [Clostridia bacterium]|nr:hypothetical protein [Clostridia bacterium]
MIKYNLNNAARFIILPKREDETMKKRITGLLIVLCIILSMAAPVSAKESEATVVKMVHSEGTHAAILSDGSLWMWGKAFSETPEKILDGIGDIQLFKGFGNTYAALGTDGSLWMWGGNDSGQLGDGTTEGRNTPVKVLDNVSRVKLVPRLWFDYGSVIGPDGRSVYGVTVIALCNDGSLWMWGGVLMGYSEVAELAAENPYRPVKVMDDVSSFEIWGNNAAIIRTDGSLWTWGVNSPYGVLGRGSAGEAGKTVYPPQKVLDNIESVTMAGNSVFALSPEGTLWQWGHVPFETEQYVEEKFSYDSPATYYAYYSPVPVRVMGNVKSLSTVERGNDLYAVALQSDGTLWTQGYYYEDHEGAEQIQKTQYDWYRALQDVREYNLGTASSGISAILKDGSLWMWGYFRLTAIGRSDKDLSYWQPSADTDYPLRVLGNAASVHGDYIFCNDGTLWQLRHLYTDEELEDRDWDDDIPRERVVKILDNVKSLEESRVDGRNYFAAICEDGSLWMWGDNQYGQLGTGDCNNTTEPVKVMDNVTAVFLDNYDFSERSGSFTYVMQRPKTYVVRGDGSFCAFGYGADGELGLKTPEQYSALPVKVTFEEPYVPYVPSVNGWGFSNIQALGYILTEQELTDKDGNPDMDKLGRIVFDKDLWTDAMGTGLESETLYRLQNDMPIVPSAVSGGLCWGMAVASALDYLGLPETKV